MKIEKVFKLERNFIELSLSGMVSIETLNSKSRDDRKDFC